MSPDGDVTTADVGVIVNRSTGAVKVSSLQVKTVNGWTLVPYGTDMAHQKVDAKIIGFSIAGTQTRKTGTTESLTLDSRWTIPRTAVWHCPTAPWSRPAPSLSRSR